MEKTAKIYVAGHRGMVGSAILRELQRQGYDNLVLRTHRELDLTRQTEVEKICMSVMQIALQGREVDIRRYDALVEYLIIDDG